MFLLSSMIWTNHLWLGLTGYTSDISRFVVGEVSKCSNGSHSHAQVVTVSIVFLLNSGISKSMLVKGVTFKIIYYCFKFLFL